MKRIINKVDYKIALERLEEIFNSGENNTDSKTIDELVLLLNLIKQYEKEKKYSGILIKEGGYLN